MSGDDQIHEDLRFCVVPLGRERSTAVLEYVARLERAEEALRETLGLAEFLNEQDPWFAENAEIDTTEIFGRAKEALAAGEENER